MSVAFWSAVVKVGKSVEVQPPDGYVLNLQQAALVDHDAKGSMVVKAHSVSIEGDKIEAVLGTLRSITQDQFSMGKFPSIVFHFFLWEYGDIQCTRFADIFLSNTHDAYS